MTFQPQMTRIHPSIHQCERRSPSRDMGGLNSHEVGSVLVDDGAKGESVPEGVRQVPDVHVRVAGARGAAPFSQRRRRGHGVGVRADMALSRRWARDKCGQVTAPTKETGNQQPQRRRNCCCEALPKLQGSYSLLRRSVERQGKKTKQRHVCFRPDPESLPQPSNSLTHSVTTLCSRC